MKKIMMYTYMTFTVILGLLSLSYLEKDKLFISLLCLGLALTMLWAQHETRKSIKIEKL